MSPSPILFTASKTSWSFLDPPIPQLHIAKNDGHVIVLEDRGHRIWLVEEPPPKDEQLAPLYRWMQEGGRQVVERAWLHAMAANGWLDVTVVKPDGDVMITAYRGTATQVGIVILSESIKHRIHHDEEVALNVNDGELIIGVGRPTRKQQRAKLRNLIWRW